MASQAPSVGEILTFPNHYNFQPRYSPKQMLAQGVYGGAFFCKNTYATGVPKDLFTGLVWGQFSRTSPIEGANVTGELVPQRRRDMDIPNFIRSVHPGGWFQWYCGFYYGKRHAADSYRIAQWVNEVKTIYAEYVKACTSASFPVNVWVNGDVTEPPQSVKKWIQCLFEISWDFRNSTMPS